MIYDMNETMIEESRESGLLSFKGATRVHCVNRLWRLSVMTEAKCMVKRYALISVLLVLTFGVVSFYDHGITLAAEEEDNIFTLSESVALALKRSLALDSADKTVEVAILDKKKAFKSILPSLNLTYSYTRLDEAPEITSVQYGAVDSGGPGFWPVVPIGRSTIDVGRADNWQAKLSLTQPLFTGFKVLTAYRLTKLGIDVAKISKVQEELDLILRVKEAYFNILGAQKAADVATQAIKRVEAHLNVARNFYEVGMITKNQVLEAEVRLAEAKQASIKAENFILIAKASFNTILRRSLQAPVEVEDILKYKPFQYGYRACLKQAMKERPEIHAVMHGIKIAEQQVRLARGDYYPTVALSANHYMKGDTPLVNGSDFIDDYTSWDVTVALTWDFFDWGKPRNSVQKSKTELAKAHNALDQVKEGIRLEVRQSYLSMKEAEKSIAVARKAIEQAEEDLRMNEERYRAQVGTTTEVIDASTRLFTVRFDYYEALISYNLAWAALERAMGLRRHTI
jgi:outer membrane protein TolC